MESNDWKKIENIEKHSESDMYWGKSGKCAPVKSGDIQYSSIANATTDINYNPQTGE